MAYIMFRGAIDHFYMKYTGDENRKHCIQVLLLGNNNREILLPVYKWFFSSAKTRKCPHYIIITFEREKYEK